MILRDLLQQLQDSDEDSEVYIKSGHYYYYIDSIEESGLTVVIVEGEQRL